jgi:hypothetical chaperone protein
MVIEPQEAASRFAPESCASSRSSRRSACRATPTCPPSRKRLRRDTTPQIRAVVAPPQQPADASAYWEGRFAELRKTASWKKYIQDNQLEESFLPGSELKKSMAEIEKQLKEQYTAAGSRPSASVRALPGARLRDDQHGASWARRIMLPSPSSSTSSRRGSSLPLGALLLGRGDETHPQVDLRGGPVGDPELPRARRRLPLHPVAQVLRASRLFERRESTARLQVRGPLLAFFKRLRAHASPQLDEPAARGPRGRPVAYAGAAPIRRSRCSATRRRSRRSASSTSARCTSPVAAAFFYAQSLEEAPPVLVADFGGARRTIRSSRSSAARTACAAEALGHAGVGVAGRPFRLPHHRPRDPAAARQGHDLSQHGQTPGTARSCFSSFASWHELSIMNTSRAFKELKEVATFSDAPDLVGRFIRLVESDQGYPLYKAVSDAKEALSREEATRFSFHGRGVEIDSTIERRDFEAWIEPELEAIEQTLDDALANSSVTERDIDRVFLTGGSSFVPAVRRIFERRFGAGSVDAGNEFVSIANGLATIGCARTSRSGS